MSDERSKGHSALRLGKDGELKKFDPNPTADMTNAPTLPDLQCACTLRERDSGHRVGCTMPQINDYITTLRAQLAAETARADACEKDARRLDWLEDESKCYWVEVQSQPTGDVVYAGSGKALREAIDAALAQS